MIGNQQAEGLRRTCDALEAENKRLREALRCVLSDLEDRAEDGVMDISQGVLYKARAAVESDRKGHVRDATKMVDQPADALSLIETCHVDLSGMPPHPISVIKRRLEHAIALLSGQHAASAEPAVWVEKTLSGE